MNRHLILCSFLLVVMGCQNVPCRELKNQKTSENGSVPAANTKAAELDSNKMPSTGVSLLKIKVYKPDGSLQCGMGKRIPLDVMEKELKGIHVYSKYNRNDGLMRIQVCGAPTGDSNVYEIKKDDLDKALKLGFKQWTAE